MGKLTKILLMISTYFLQSCFPFADTYEKNVNEYFWLFSDYHSDDVFIGVIDTYHDLSFTNHYIGPVKQIGWNDKHVIVEDKNKMFYIQELSQLENTSTENYNKYLHEYHSFSQFKDGRNQLNVDEDLEFEIEY